jgi:hypothetical protein
MAIRGRKPRATAVKIVAGNPGKRRLNSNEPMTDGRPSPPIPLKGRPLALWRRFITKAWWLTSTDSPTCWLWVQLHAEAENDVAGMNATRLAQLRALASELGFNPASRSQLVGTRTPPGSDPASRFF